MLKAADGTENPASTWIFRTARAAIKKDREAMVLVGNAAIAIQDAQDKRKAMH